MRAFIFLLLSTALFCSGADKPLKDFTDQGHAFTQLNLGGMYAYGKGAPENDGEAFKLYRKGCQAGIHKNSVQSLDHVR